MNGANRSTSEIMLRLPTLLLPWTSPTASLRETHFPIRSSYGQDVHQSETMSTTTPPSRVMYPCIILSPYTTRATLLLPPPLPSASATRLPQTKRLPKWWILAWHIPAPMWITPSRYPTAPWPLKTLELMASDRSPESQPLHSVSLPIQCVQLQYHQPNWTYQDHTGKKWLGDQDWFGSVLWVFPEAVAFPWRGEADLNQHSRHWAFTLHRMIPYSLLKHNGCWLRLPYAACSNFPFGFFNAYGNPGRIQHSVNSHYRSNDNCILQHVRTRWTT